METRGRKRPEASSSSSQSSQYTSIQQLSLPSSRRSAKHSRKSTSSFSSSQVMDPPPSSSSADRRSEDRSKDKEPPEPSVAALAADRDRLRDIEEAISLSLDAGHPSGDKGDADGSPPGILHHNLTSAVSALGGILRKLGASLDELLPAPEESSSHQTGWLNEILTGLRAEGEEGKQVESLTQLCGMLSIGGEDSLSSFSVDSFAPVLVGLANHESNSDIRLLADWALSHLCDVLQSAWAAVLFYRGEYHRRARLLSMNYADLAEQSLLVLETISQKLPTACLHAGALMAVLSYLDLFPTRVQRVGLNTAANMCKKLPFDAGDFVMEAVPLLIHLHNHDSKVLDLAFVCLSHITEVFASSPDKLDELCNHGLASLVASFITVGNSGGAQASLTTSTYTGLIHLLSTLASGSALGGKSLHLLGISGILKDILSGSELDSSISISPFLTRPPEQIFEIVSLADELLPPISHGTISPSIVFHSVKNSLVKSPPVNIGNKQDDTDGAAAAVVHGISVREKLLLEKPELLQQFGMDLLPVLIQMCGSSVNAPVRRKCLSVIAKLMCFSTADMIKSLLNPTNISSFLAGILAFKDPQVLILALRISEILMEKLPETFSKIFVREGVLHAVDALIIPESSGSASVPTVSCAHENDNTVTSSSFQYRRHNASLNANASISEEQRNPGQGNIESPPCSNELPSANSSFQKAVSTCAKSFKDKFFQSEPGESEIGVTDDLVHLKNLCAKLNGTEATKSKANKSKASEDHSFEICAEIEEQLNGYISEMLVELSKGDGVSTFEFIVSGVISSLLNYLSCGCFLKEKISKVSMSKLHQQALKRYKSFINVSLPIAMKEGVEISMTILVQKLQSALTSLEHFPVVLSDASRSQGGSSKLSSGLSILSQPFKLCLCRNPGDESLRDYSSNIVLIDPITSLAAIEEFLWPRIQHSETVQKASAGNDENGARATSAGVSPPMSPLTSAGCRHATRLRSSLEIGGIKRMDLNESDPTASKGKRKAVLKSALEENKGFQTRSAVCRRVASDIDAHMKPDLEISSTEDEDTDISSDEVEDALVIEEDDASEDEDADHNEDEDLDISSSDEFDDASIIEEDEDEDHDEVLREASLPVFLRDWVHDVKLDDPAEGGDIASSTGDAQAQLSSGSSTKASQVRETESTDIRGPMPYAASAIDELPSVSGRDFRGDRDRHGFLLACSSSEPPKLLFYSGGKPLSRNLTIYQAIRRQLVLEEDQDDKYNSESSPSDGNRLWNDIFTITYKKTDSQGDQDALGGSLSQSGKSFLVSSSGNEAQWKQISLLDSILQGELPCDLEKSDDTYNILALLRVLEGLNQLAPRLRYQSMTEDYVEGRVSRIEVPSTSGSTVLTQEFVNRKLASKLMRQMQDDLAVCSGSLPPWCYQLTKACPFLFPFETRRQFFSSTAFGPYATRHRLLRHGADKVRVSRNHILDSSIKVMEMYSSRKDVLEVEYFGEVGSGLGPTLEFYSLLSLELQKTCLQMWRSNSAGERDLMDMDSDNYGHFKQNEDVSEVKKSTRDSVPRADNFIQAPLGLFPRPWSPNVDTSDSKFSKVIEYFQLTGQVMAKVLQDGRLLDLPFSMAFYKLVLGQELDLHDILSFDAEFGKTLQEMQLLVDRKKYLEANAGNKLQEISELRFRDTPIEDLCLDFTLPGYPDYILKGDNTLVSIDNLEDYISLVVDAIIKTGISRQMEALRAGFNQVFDITSLQIFSPEELHYLLCGRRELWKAEKLVDDIKFDHGYTAKSPTIINLLEIMGEFTPEQQRAFCQFVTGAPRLPPGGLAALNPKLTIVRRHSSSATTGTPESADGDLPTVTTCANYVKLPPYSSKEIMYKKLLYAITEGQGSFDLS